jgi:uncharacterized damage-inducible protein DinB
MNPEDTLTTLFGHNLWANLRLLECCAALSPEQLDAGMPGAYGSIRDTWEHIALAERRYFTRISTGKPYERREDAPPLTQSEMADSLRESGAGLIAWAPRVQPGDAVEIDWDGTLTLVPRAILLTQAINHATEHRAQIMAILTQQGIDHPNLDGWSYFEAGGEQAR